MIGTWEDIREIADQYVGTMLWSESCRGNVANHEHSTEDPENCDVSLDAINFTRDDLSEEAQLICMRDIVNFLDNAQESNELVFDDIDLGQIGHDFYLTRNHHGAGFWDRGLGEIGTELTKAAHAAGEVEIYVGDDGKIYVN